MKKYQKYVSGNVDPQLEKDYERAMEFMRISEDYESAIQILENLDNKYPDLPHIKLMLGHAYDEIGDLDNAIIRYKALVTLRPKYELASRGLFHALDDKGDIEGAFEEMRRFLTYKWSKNYDDIFTEYNKYLEEGDKELEEELLNSFKEDYLIIFKEISELLEKWRNVKDK